MTRGSLERLRAELHADPAAWALRLAELRELDAVDDLLRRLVDPGAG